MAKYKKGGSSSPQTEQEAGKIAGGIQKPGQTKEQTKLITQGIQKGIDLYKKQQKTKQRELDKNRKKTAKENTVDTNATSTHPQTLSHKQHWLPWTLLLLTWIGIAVFAVFFYH